MPYLYQLLLLSLYIQLIHSRKYNIGWNCQYANVLDDCQYLLRTEFPENPADDQINLAGNYALPECLVNGTAMTIEKFDRDKQDFPTYYSANPLSQLRCEKKFHPVFHLTRRIQNDNRVLAEGFAIRKCLEIAANNPSCKINAEEVTWLESAVKTIAVVGTGILFFKNREKFLIQFDKKKKDILEILESGENAKPQLK